jgi:hypothetical protein
MPEGIPSASSNVTASIGSTFNYVANKIFGYSGSVNVATSGVITIFEDRTSKTSCSLRGMFFLDKNVADDIDFELSLNDLVVFSVQQNMGTTNSRAQYFPVDLVIPPLTLIKCTAENLTGSNTMDCGVVFVGELL